MSPSYRLLIIHRCYKSSRNTRIRRTLVITTLIDALCRRPVMLGSIYIYGTDVPFFPPKVHHRAPLAPRPASRSGTCPPCVPLLSSVKGGVGCRGVCATARKKLAGRSNARERRGSREIVASSKFVMWKIHSDPALSTTWKLIWLSGVHYT